MHFNHLFLSCSKADTTGGHQTVQYETNLSKITYINP